MANCRLLVTLAVAMLSGCAVQHPKAEPPISQELAQAIGESVAQYASALYPPAATKLHLSVAMDPGVGQSVSDALTHRGFGVSDGDGASGIQFDYTVESLNGRALVQVTTPGRAAACLVGDAISCDWTVRYDQ